MPEGPVDLLVKVLAAVPEADRDLVYAWLLRRAPERASPERYRPMAAGWQCRQPSP
jgi:hypothetical protein